MEECKKPKMKERHQPAPKVTISEMMTIADRIKQETGRYPSYGEVTEGIISGRIKPEDYIGKGRKR